MARYSVRAWRSLRPAPAATAAATTIVVASADAHGRCRVLGLDPGSRRTGYGVVDCAAGQQVHVASGCINASGADLVTRLRHIYEAIAALVEAHRPDEVAIERVFMHRNADSALKLGQARGAALCGALILPAPVHEYAPRAIKLAVTGFGAAEKSQVAQMVVTLLGLARCPQADAADALAVALCHAQTRRLTALLRQPATRRVAGTRAGLRS
jgi:crossover junction endodeoxyribonuclease RuvC